MKNKKNRQWNKYYFTITFHSKRETKPVIMYPVVAHSREQAYMKLIIAIQDKELLKRYRFRSVKIIHVDTNISTNDINGMCCWSKNSLIAYYKTCRNNKLVDLMFQTDCPYYNSRHGTCMAENKSCDMIHTNYCNRYIEEKLLSTIRYK